MFEGLDKNGDGYKDSTAYHAIIRASLDESRRDQKVDEFVKELYKLCDKNDVSIVGNVTIKVKNKNGINKVLLDSRNDKRRE